MVNLTLKAADDITDYYYNVMLQYPNTWDVTDVMTQSDKVADAIWEKANRIIKRLSLVGGQVKSPLLKSLQANGMVEAYAESVGWQFTLRCDKSTNEYYVDNAIKGQNMSNRANRRGTSNPYAPLSDDDRENQTLMNCSKNKSKNVIRLTESMLKAMVTESLMHILKEYHEYRPVSHNKEITLNNGVKVKSLVTLSDGAGVYEIWEDDGCYVCCDMNYYRNNEDYQPMYIFPELLSALKDLPNLPLR